MRRKNERVFPGTAGVSKAVKQTDRLAALLRPELQNKDVLEVACGTAELSLSASAFARSVVCIDLDGGRLSPGIAGMSVCFQLMDAAEMDFPDGRFDTVVLYNALYHVFSQWREIERECLRVLRPGGSLLLLGTWKLDIRLMQEHFGEKARQVDDFWIVRLKKA